MEPQFYDNAIFYIETDKIQPNPFQPRHEFNEEKLSELAESIRQYGILQPLVVTRHEEEREDGLSVYYELIAGERRLRAAKKAGIPHIPAVIRPREENDRMKLELAIIENLQREDLTPVDRALAFKKLVDQFGFKHSEVAKKVGKSREYVSNTLRLLVLPQDILDALAAGNISEGHARSLGMLSDRPEEQTTLFKEITIKKISVRETEQIARRIAHDKVRKHDVPKELLELEGKFTEALGTRVKIDKREVGGRVVIDFFSQEDLQTLLDRFDKEEKEKAEGDVSQIEQPASTAPASEGVGVPTASVGEEANTEEDSEHKPVRTEEEDSTLYSIKNFSI